MYWFVIDWLYWNWFNIIGLLWCRYIVTGDTCGTNVVGDFMAMLPALVGS